MNAVNMPPSRENRHVEVAIPIYNGSLFIEEAVESVVDQSHKVNRILLIDDSSCDTTAEVSRKIINKYDGCNIQYFRNPVNVGYSANWNRCFEYCEGRYLVILHQDDVLKRNTIETQLKYFQVNQEIALVGGIEDGIDENSNITYQRKSDETKVFKAGEIYEFISQTGSYIPCSSVMFDMEKVRKVGFFQDGVIAADELYWPKVLLKYPIAILGEPLIDRRYHPNQIEYHDFKNKPQQIVGWWKHFERIMDYETRDDKKAELRPIMRKKMSNALAGHVMQSTILYHKSLGLGLYYIVNAVKIYPMIMTEPRFWKHIIYVTLRHFGVKFR
jgi:glycosyltransferase involved in cell wall biosynthesis